jgi:tRNA (mo5U34)-methyltransferase
MTNDMRSISEKVSSVLHWYHQINMPDGTVTPGINNSPGTMAIYEKIGFPADLSGKRVLDVGCADGYYSFICEQRGAKEVIAIDYRQPTASGFSVAASILGSKVKHVVDNVYDISPEKYGEFDFIIFVGVLYHLRNPLLALDNLRRMAKPNATVLVESHIADDEIREALQTEDLTEKQIDAISKISLWKFYYSNTLNNDASNKWAPTFKALGDICKEAQLKIIDQEKFGSRGAILCRSISDNALEHSRKMDSATGLNVA